MPTNLDNQVALRKAQQLSFCYVCGRTMPPGETLNRDHLPPKTIFAQKDREPPLILRTHSNCNQRQSGNDEIIGQLVQAIHGKYPGEKNRRLDVREYSFEAIPALGLVGVPPIDDHRTLD